MHQDKEVAAEDVTVVMTQVSLMGTVRERPPGSGGWIIVPYLRVPTAEGKRRLRENPAVQS